MTRWGTVNYRQLEAFQRKLNNLDNLRDAFMRAAARELAARLLRKVVKRTPVGEYPEGTGMVGGTLRRGWTGETEANGAAYAQNLPITETGDSFVIDIINPVDYASYVEFGHRTRGGKGWVPGKFMLTKSEIEINRDAPKILEKKLAKWLGDNLT